MIYQTWQEIKALSKALEMYHNWIVFLIQQFELKLLLFEIFPKSFEK